MARNLVDGDTYEFVEGAEKTYVDGSPDQHSFSMTSDYYKTLQNVVYVDIYEPDYTGGTIGTLPVGYRPRMKVYFPCILIRKESQDKYSGCLEIDATGEITATAMNYVNNYGVNLTAEEYNLRAICSFVAADV